MLPMTSIKTKNIALDQLCRTAIKQNLGDLSELPKEVVDGVFHVYREFMPCYLNILRQKENKPADWMPENLAVDSELTDQMRHFFSDYQHITREYYKLNQKVDRLQALDKDNQAELYQYHIGEILKGFEPRR
jgi:hypothetical protein